MTVPVSCPYCNASVVLNELPPSGRTVCSRCGEAFPVHAPADDDAPRLPVASDNGPLDDAPWPHPTEPATVGSLRTFAVIGTLLGAVIVAVGLYYVSRTPNSGPIPPTNTDAPKFATTVPPAVLTGLALLPPDTNIAFAVQPGPLLTHADRTQTDPRKSFATVGVPDRVLTTLDRLGLKPELIDHLAGGLVLAVDQPLKVVFVLRLREPLVDRSEFLKQLKATQTTAASGQIRYNVDAGGLALAMANPDPRTYLFALDPADLEPPTRTGPPDAHLPAGLRESMARLSPASFAWAATNAADWSANPGLKVLAALAKQPDLPARLTGVRAVALGVSLEPEPQLTAAVRAVDPDAAQKLKEQVTTTLTGTDRMQISHDGAWVKVAGPPQADAWAGLESLLPTAAGK